MITTAQVPSVIGSVAFDPQGDRIGTVGQVYLDDHTGDPVWATVRTGLFGTRESFVPINQAELAGQQLRVQVSKSQVKEAPHIAAVDEHLDEAQATELYRYYNLPFRSGRAAEQNRQPRRGQAEQENTRPVPSSAGRDYAAVDADRGTGAEQARAGSGLAEAGQVKLRRYVTGGEDARIVDEEMNVTLHEERPVATDGADRRQARGKARKERVGVGEAAPREAAQPHAGAHAGLAEPNASAARSGAADRSTAEPNAYATARNGAADRSGASPRAAQKNGAQGRNGKNRRR